MPGVGAVRNGVDVAGLLASFFLSDRLPAPVAFGIGVALEAGEALETGVGGWRTDGV